MRPKIVIVGGGIIGLATAYKLLLGTKCSVTLLEKEQAVAKHQSGRNSGVLHAGLYYKPGSLKATLSRSGIHQMIDFCKANGVNYEQCGKLVVATDESEAERLQFLLKNGTANGLDGLKTLSPSEIVKIEPYVRGVSAVHVPEEGIVDYIQVCEKLRTHIERMGGQICFGQRVQSVVTDQGSIRVQTATNTVHEADFVINCAGLYSDKVAAAFGIASDVQIIPFRGEYFHLNANAAHLIKHLVYPVPDITYPFLGVHFTRMINGGVEAGPNAVLAFRREGYSLTDINIPELMEALSFSGLRKFLVSHRQMVAQEVSSSLFVSSFLERLQKMVPAIRKEHLSKGLAGVRAQAMRSDGTLVQDFEIAMNKHSLHLINAPSPGATSSLAIADYVIEQIPF